MIRFYINGLNKRNKTRYNFIFHTLKTFALKIQATPNPHFLKFLPGKEILKDGETFDFANISQATNSPLATKLFGIDGVNKVFYGRDYISVGKKELIEWTDIKSKVESEIDEFFQNEGKLFDHEQAQTKNEEEANKGSESEVVSLIKEIIATRISPVVQEDGGDIKFISFDEPSGTVFLSMKGSCKGCPSSSVTLKSGIEKMLIHYVAEVKEVEAVDDE